MPPTRLTATVVRDPSRGYTELPTTPQRDLVVVVDEHQDGIRIGLFGIVPRHSAVVRRKPGELEAVADKLRQGWERRLVRFQERDEHGYPSGGFPFAENLDLSGKAPRELDKALVRLQELGWQLLNCLTDGAGKTEKALLGALGGKELRISFESKTIHLPWSMMCLCPEGDEPSLDLFLGYRHQIEQTGCLNEPHDPPSERPAGERPKASLNADASLAPQVVGAVADLLAEATTLRTRHRARDLLAELRDEGYDEELMYFWCHGFFEGSSHGTSRPRLAIRLHPQDEAIDSAELGAALRRSAPGRLIRSPLVLLNACNTGRPGDGDVHHLGRTLVEKGAGGVLAPQIEVPVVSAAHYGRRFLELYLRGQSAGEAARALAREFADQYRSPLGLVYTLHYGLDCRLTTPCFPQRPPQEPPVDRAVPGLSPTPVGDTVEKAPGWAATRAASAPNRVVERSGKAGTDDKAAVGQEGSTHGNDTGRGEPVG